MRSIGIETNSLVKYIFLGLFLSEAVFGSGIDLLNITFEKPIWRELIKQENGVSSTNEVTNGILRLHGCSVWKTQKFPYLNGSQISINIRLKFANIPDVKTTENVGRVVLTGVNSIGKQVCNFDVALFRGDTNWNTFSFNKTLPEIVDSFYLSIINTGDSWYDNLSLSVENDKTEHLIGDAGFEGSLGVDHWFYYKYGHDWDDLKKWGESSGINVDTNLAVIGKQCVKLENTATLVSKRFDYRGEPLVLSGWLRTENIKKGSKNWCKAAVQIVAFDAEGKEHMHTDLILQDGTSPWRFYQKKVQFQSTIKEIQVWIRIFDGATGKAWFDNVSLQSFFISKNDKPHLNLSSANLQINTLTLGDLINYRVWAGVDISYIARLSKQAHADDLIFLKNIGVEMIRTREISAKSLGTYNRDDPETGKPVYNWAKLDTLFDILVRKYHFIPNVTLESTPPALARKGTPTNKHCNRWPPSNYAKWSKYIEAFMDHIVDRYGKEEVQKWYWEIWNEPMAEHYYKGTPEEFLMIAESTYSALERVEKRHGINLKIGLTSGGQWVNNYVLEYLKEKHKLYLIDHYSEHFYFGACTPLRLITERIDKMKRLLKEYPSIGQCELGCTEWNCNSMGGKLAQSPWNAACAVKTVKLMLDAGLDYTTFFSYHDFRYSDKTPTFNSLSMIALNGVPKPVYNAFTFLNELKGGRRLKVQSSNDPIDGIAVLMPDGAIRILITNFDEDISRQPYNTKVTLNITGTSLKAYRCIRHWAADNKYGNSYGKWLDMGQPPASDTHAKSVLLKASRYGVLSPIDIVHDDDTTLQLTFTVPSAGIRFIELKPTK